MNPEDLAIVHQSLDKIRLHADRLEWKADALNEVGNTCLARFLRSVATDLNGVVVETDRALGRMVGSALEQSATASRNMLNAALATAAQLSGKNIELISALTAANNE